VTVPVEDRTAAPDAVVGKHSTLDRFLPVWIGVAMLAGILLGRGVPGLGGTLEAVQVDGVSLPIALGLLIMMYPVLAKVCYVRVDTVTGDKRLLVSSLLMNWVLGPALMFALVWVFLPDLPEYRTGLIIVGLARCIAMVIIWNDLACGDREAAAVLVAINSVFQVFAFALLGWFYLSGAARLARPGPGQHRRLHLRHRPQRPDLPGRSAARRVPVPPARRAGPGPRLVRERLPAAGRAVRPVRPAVHHRGAVRAAGRPDHRRPARRRPDRPAAAGLLRPDVGRRLRPRELAAPGLRLHHHARVHRRRQQLRARHRGRDRHLRRHLRPGPRRRRRTPDRGARPGRPGPRQPRAAPPQHPHRRRRPPGPLDRWDPS